VLIGSQSILPLAFLGLEESCDILGLEESFQGNCFGHAFLKLANMLQQRRKFVDIYNMCQSSCPKRFAKMHNVAKKI
jgi:hypothetical protein